MKTFVFPGQGAQFEGMGLELKQTSTAAAEVFNQADEILGFELSKLMFYGSAEDLKQTRVTQPALFVHAIATLKAKSDVKPDAVAGHSLGEFTALVANGCLSFEDGLKLVYARAMAMQAACDAVPGTMAAILGLDDDVVEKICASIDEVVVAANYNCPGQLVISGSDQGIQIAIRKLTEAGAKRALQLPVGGAFHSPLMEPAKTSLETEILNTHFADPICPIYQNINALPSMIPTDIRQKLIAQLTGPVRWTQTIQRLIADGCQEFIEVGGSGKVLSGLIKKVDRNVETSTL